MTNNSIDLWLWEKIKIYVIINITQKITIDRPFKVNAAMSTSKSYKNATIWLLTNLYTEKLSAKYWNGKREPGGQKDLGWFARVWYIPSKLKLGSMLMIESWPTLTQNMAEINLSLKNLKNQWLITVHRIYYAKQNGWLACECEKEEESSIIQKIWYPSNEKFPPSDTVINSRKKLWIPKKRNKYK